LREAFLHSDWNIWPLRAQDIVWWEWVEKLQLNENGLTKDFNNVTQVLIISLWKLLWDDSNFDETLENILQIQAYRVRDIYINNSEDFLKLEEEIPGLKLRITKLDEIIEWLKREFLSLQKKFSEWKKTILFLRLWYVIQQVQEILNSYYFPLNPQNETKESVHKTLEQ